MSHNARALQGLGLLERFNAYFDRGDNKQCWLWKGKPIKDGYGNLSVDGKDTQAHRYAYVLAFRTVPSGFTVDHLCRTRLCVNPSHLEAVTIAENVLRGIGGPAVNRRKTHCIRGHEFTENNTYCFPQKDGSTGRACIECRSNYRAARKANEMRVS